jgi:Calcineurin-like phosphoesterase
MVLFDVIDELDEAAEGWMERPAAGSGYAAGTAGTPEPEGRRQTEDWLVTSARDVLEVACHPEILSDFNYTLKKPLVRSLFDGPANPFRLDGDDEPPPDPADQELAERAAGASDEEHRRAGPPGVLNFLSDAVWTVIHLPVGLLGLALGALAFPVMAISRRQKRLLRLICDDDPRVTYRLKVSRLPVADRYVVFSDHHLFRKGSRLDAFGEGKLEELYLEVLADYEGRDFFLIENGDVEDLWERDPSALRALADYVAIPVEAEEVIVGSPLQKTAETALLRRIIADFRPLYSAIQSRFRQRNRYARIVGNHDLDIQRPRLTAALREVYPHIEVQDCVVLVATNEDGVETGYPEYVIMHGHQFDAWNNAVVGNAAGEPITSFSSGFAPEAFAAHLIKKKEWEKDMRRGFKNRLVAFVLPHLPERAVARRLRRTFKDAPHIPHVVLGHSHVPKWRPHLRRNGKEIFENYSNCGTAGRYEDLLWCIEIDHGTASLHACITPRTVGWCAKRCS